MTYQCPVVPLGEVASHRKEFITIDDTAVYKRCRVQLHAQGIVERDRILGVMIRTKEQQLCRANELLVAEIDAKVGGFGIVPPELEGAIVSSHYFLFALDVNRIDPQFLGYFVKTPAFRDQVNARGSTNYAAIRPHHVLEYQIPLPPLAEQRRIVAKIECIAAKIEDVQGLRRKSEMEAVALLRSGRETVFRELQSTIGCETLADVSESITDGDHLTPPFSDHGVRFIFVGNVSTGRLHFENSKRVSDAYFNSLSYRRVPKRGDILYSAVGATLGVPAIVETDKSFCFQRHVAIVKPDRGKVDSRLVWHMLQSSTVFEKAWASTTGSAQPTIPLRAIRKLPMPVPSFPDQLRIVAYLNGLQAKVERLKALQAQTRAELDALLPSILDRAFKGEL